MRQSAGSDSMRIRAKLARTRLLAMDVDGVLTEGTLGYDSAGSEQKRFHVADGLGLVVLRQAGITIAWLSGRASPIVERRGAELAIPYVLQGIRDKGGALTHLGAQLGLECAQMAYIGDDWNDLPAFEVVGTRIAVANAAYEVKMAADIVTERSGGQGAVREVCEALLDALDVRVTSLRIYLDSLQDPDSSARTGQ